MFKNIFFDLDGTLLPMDQKAFIKGYVNGVGQIASIHGYDPKSFTNELLTATDLMLSNDGTKTNEEVFWLYFLNKFPNSKIVFEEYYNGKYKELNKHIFDNGASRQILDILKKKGYKLILATNPVFPLSAVIERMSWANIYPDDFSYITTFENSSFTKPKEDYFNEILRKNDLNPNETIMVGNDILDDFSCLNNGIKKVLINDCALNSNCSYDGDKVNLDELLEYIFQL